jgi:hypothetical protein
MRSFFILVLIGFVAASSIFGAASADEEANRNALLGFFSKLKDLSGGRANVSQYLDASFVYRPYGGQPILQSLFSLPVPKNDYNSTEYVTILTSLPASTIFRPNSFLEKFFQQVDPQVRRWAFVT